MCKATIVAFLSMFIVSLLGCASTPTFLVEIDSRREAGSFQGRSYVLVSGMEDVVNDDLQFREFSKYIHNALRIKGYTLASNPQNADLGVLLLYGLGQPKTIHYSYLAQMIGQIGEATYRHSPSTDWSDGYSSHTPGNLSPHSGHGVASSWVFTRRTPASERYFMIEAVDIGESKRRGEIVPVWRTTVTSTGISADLRRVLPVMVAGSGEYIGTNTGRQITVIHEDDQRVRQIKVVDLNATTRNYEAPKAPDAEVAIAPEEDYGDFLELESFQTEGTRLRWLIRNKGDKTVSHLIIKAKRLDSQGRVVHQKLYRAVPYGESRGFLKPGKTIRVTIEDHEVPNSAVTVEVAIHELSLLEQ